MSSFVESGSKSITLTPSEETFTTGEGVIYNVLVYPGSHSSLSVELTDSDNCKHANTVTPDNPYVFNAASSKSTPKTTSYPASKKPRDKPPAPENKDIAYKGFTSLTPL